MKKRTITGICVTGVMTALYAALSMTAKIPIVGHITLDLGYLVVTVMAIMYGCIPSAIVASGGCLISSALSGNIAWSIGWVCMNLVVGLISGVLRKTRKNFFMNAAIIIAAVLAGVVVKTFIEVAIIGIPLAAKIPKAIAAFAVDSIVMIAGLPMAYKIKEKFIKEN